MLFATSADSLFAFDLTTFDLLASWKDEVDPYYSVKKHHEELVAQYNKEEHIDKKQKKTKIPKLPTPGPTAPPKFTYIRGLTLSRNKQYLIVLTDNDKAAVVFKINDTGSKDKGFKFDLIKRQPFPKRPSAVTTSLDDRDVIVADKFGDVYSVPIAGEAVDEKKLKPILGHVSLLTCVDSARDEDGHPCVITSDRDEHIRISYYPKSFLIKKWLFGHTEFVSTFVLPDWCDGKLIVSGGGDTFICSWLWQNPEGHELIDKLELSGIVKSYLGDFHLAPKKFQDETGEKKEFCVTCIVPLSVCKKLAVVIEHVPAIFLVGVDNGKMAYEKTIEMDGNIIDATYADDTLILSLDNDEKPVVAYSVAANGDIELSSKSTDKLDNYRIEATDKKMIPLFREGKCRKRREH